ncbi:MAG: hypothetical protein NTV43_06840 [Methylococcales bacterium]|nr:hypothetical protein [Methylococcales bacterium]
MIKSAWKEQIKEITKTLVQQEHYQELLKSIDEHIINSRKISETLDFVGSKLLSLTKAKSGCFVFGTSYLLFGEKNTEHLFHEPVEIIADKKDLAIYIDKIILKFEKNENISNFEEIGLSEIGDFNLDENLVKMVRSIGIQINIAINQSVLISVHQLYKDIINEFSKKGDSDDVYETICRKIINVFPQTKGYPRVNESDISVQLLYFYEKDKLRIIGSTNKSEVGGNVDVCNSISGSLFKLTESTANNDGYKEELYKGNRYIYFMGNPNNGNFNYKKTISGITKSELAVPLYIEDNSTSPSSLIPVGVINIESSEDKYFRETHARSIIYHSNNIAELVDNIYQLSSRRQDILKGMIYTLEEYIRSANREFDHQIRQPLHQLDMLVLTLEKNVGFENNTLLNKIKEIYTNTFNARKMLSASLKSFSARKRYIDLENIINDVSKLLAETINYEKIEFHSNININSKKIKLDNLFVQYLYDLIRNSIDSIASKKNRRAIEKENKIFNPKITISAELVDEFSRNDDSIISDENNKRCLIKIHDNGDGMDKDLLGKLGEDGFTFGKSHGTGKGLYSFKQYLSFNNGRIDGFESEKYEFFSISFIVDIEE